MELQNSASGFWRIINVDTGPHWVRGEVIDNVHHFVVELRHDGTKITQVTGEAIRFPWTTCPAATVALATLIGSSVEPGRRLVIDQAHQCTHMLDTARLAIAHIARGGRRRYDMRVSRTDDLEVCTATIDRDDARLFEWIINSDTIISPSAFAGHNLNGRAVWHSSVEGDSELKEAALALRRSVFVFRSRPRSALTIRADQLEALRNVCFSFQSIRVNDAVRPVGFRELDV